MKYTYEELGLLAEALDYYIGGIDEDNTFFLKIVKDLADKVVKHQSSEGEV